MTWFYKPQDVDLPKAPEPDVTDVLVVSPEQKRFLDDYFASLENRTVPEFLRES